MAGFRNKTPSLSRLPVTGISFVFDEATAIDPDIFNRVAALRERLLREATLHPTGLTNTVATDEGLLPEPEDVHLFNLRERRFERWLITNVGQSEARLPNER